jgi:hypothetical protein
MEILGRVEMLAERDDREVRRMCMFAWRRE